MHILLVEDDLKVRDFIVRGMRGHDHTVTDAADGQAGLELALKPGFDLIILDRMLPGGVDGVQLLEQIRAQNVTTPVLILSALTEVDERVVGLNAGSDDYMSKPFAFSELMARAEALIRRSCAQDNIQTRLSVGDLEMDLLSRSVRRGDQKIDLQPREFRLLEFLMRHVGQIVARTMLLERVWDYHFDPQTNVIDVHVSRLRQKLDKPFATSLIHTVRNAGYVLKSE
ncbi:MAG: response regulator transcription factor [Acetobacteraceae bacterium]